MFSPTLSWKAMRSKRRRSSLQSNGKRSRKLLAESLEPRRVMAAYINEVHFSPLFGDATKHQYVELRGDALATMNAGTYLVVINSADGVTELGDIHSIFNLSNQQFGSNGMLVLLQSASNFTVNPAASVLKGTDGFAGMPGNIFSADASNSKQIRGGSNTFLLIESAVPPTLTNDIDLNDDGTPDGAYTNWRILDGFTAFPWVESVWPQKAYAPIVFQQDGVGSGMPGATLVRTEDLAYVSRIGLSTGYAANDWVAGNTTEDNTNSWTFQLEDGIFGVPRPRAYAGRRLDHIGGPNWVGNISGSVFVDLNSDGVRQADELPIANAQVLSDLTGDNTTNLYSETIEPNRYLVNTDLTNVSYNATITTAGTDNLPINFNVTNVQKSGAPTGEYIFSHSGIGFFSEIRRLRTDFYRPARSVSIDFIGNSNLSATYGRLEIFGANDQSLGFVRTGPLLQNQLQRLTLTSGNDAIAWAVAYSEDSYLSSSPFGMLDNLSFELAEQSTVTDAQGNYLLQSMTPGNYAIRVVPPNNYDLVFPASGTHAISINKYENIGSRNFGLLGNVPPTINDQSFRVSEDTSAETVVAVLQFAKGYPSQNVSASITAGDPSNLFSIEAATGNLMLNRAELDFETKKTYTLTVTYSDQANASLNDMAVINLIIDDANEAPVVTASSKSLNENSAANTVVTTMVGSDVDAGLAGQFLWSIAAGNIGNAFAIDPNSGSVRVADASKLDYEGTRVFNLTVRATDRGTPTKFGEGNLEITLLNVNEAPALLAQALSINENSSAGTLVGTLNSGDPDANENLTWVITGGTGMSLFQIDNQGKIYLAANGTLDFEKTSSYDLSVQVTDAGALSNQRDYQISIQNLNDAPILNAPAQFSVNENAASGFVVGTVTATDQDAGQLRTFSLGGTAASKFVINATSGEITVADGATFDFETAPSLSLIILVTDNGAPALSASSVVAINVANVNEAPIIPAASFQIPENTVAGSEVAILGASDPDTGDTLTYTIVQQTHNWISIDASTGKLKVATGAVIDFETANQNSVLVRATDAGGLSAERTLQFTAVDRNDAPTIVNPIPNGNVNANALFSYTIPANTAIDQDAGDTLRYFVTDSLGFPLPAWLSFNATTRVLSGTPSMNDGGPVALKFTAVDSAGLNASSQFTVTVNAITHPWYNTASPLDTNNSGAVSPLDALVVINYLNSGASRSVAAGTAPTFGYLDTSRDNVISPLDALLVINVLNRRASGEGEFASASQKDAQVNMSTTTPAQTAFFEWTRDQQEEERRRNDDLIDLLAASRESTLRTK